jgi:uncharacterized membrane protein
MNTLTLAATNMQMSTADWFLMALGLLVFAALLLWLGSTLAGKERTGAEAPSEEVSALHLLDRRLARGEITVEQREQARRILAGEREEASADVLA